MTIVEFNSDGSPLPDMPVYAFMGYIESLSIPIEDIPDLIPVEMLFSLFIASVIRDLHQNVSSIA